MLHWLKSWIKSSVEEEEEIDVEQHLATANAQLDRLEALLDRVEQEDNATISTQAAQIKDFMVENTKYALIRNQPDIPLPAFPCTKCHSALLIAKRDNNMIMAMCPARATTPSGYDDHTSMQFDGKNWYGADNYNFMHYFKKSITPAIMGTVSYTSPYFSMGTSYDYK